MAESDPGIPHVDVAGYVLDALTAEEREAFEAHLQGCPDCQHELEELRKLPILLDQAAAPIEVPVGLEAKVLTAVAREPARRLESPSRVVPPEGRRHRWHLRASWTAAAVAALLLSFVGGVGLDRLLNIGASTPRPPGPTQTVQLVAANGGAAKGTARIHRSSVGQVIELTVEGLPPPSPDHFYTCWLVADDDTPLHQNRVSVGSFTTAGTGSVTLHWETGADLTRYPHMGVTLEPDNGSPLHQGPKVLQATTSL